MSSAESDYKVEE